MAYFSSLSDVNMVVVQHTQDGTLSAMSHATVDATSCAMSPQMEHNQL